MMYVKQNTDIVDEKLSKLQKGRIAGPFHSEPFENFPKIVSVYDQKIPQSQTADKPMAPRGSVTQHSRDIRKTN